MKILVIMPVYNQEDRIEYAIESVINQTYSDWHMIIIDDCSTDNTSSILEQYTTHPQITIITNTENRGCYYSRNIGLKTALDIEYKWDLHTIHDSDDISSHMRFEQCIKPFKNDPIGVLTTRYGRTYDNIKKFTEECSITRNSLGLGIGFYHKDIFNGIGYYDNTRFGGDSEYYERALLYCKHHMKLFIGTFDSEMLYIAINHSENLTNTINESRRLNYTIKFRNEHDVMLNNLDFYRSFG